ncbi:Leucine-rich repeat (LRR) protein [Evansella vedderi]|uniref:Leucine-rich repeat (LRR) protein n=1 Tax=Evansella vedderi TaxID=38282 RepID=A0ABT9ZT62_9BACI|nr:CotH kinase family protein [Evansella vedderi]MDQ0254432.1 Leucine-rich repeat (LRR) protein [Evansella vedderi]
MIKYQILFLTLVLLFSVGSWNPLSSFTGEKNLVAAQTLFIDGLFRKEITIPDPMLEEAIREELDLPEGMLEAATVKKVESLSLRNRNIQDLRGLEHFTSLLSLNLRGNYIEDITPLMKLKKLEELNLRENKVIDISPLKKLSNLKELNLSYNRVSNIKPLAGLKNLNKKLFLNGNPIVAYSPVFEAYRSIKKTDFQLPVVFSKSGGFYEREVQLELISPYPEAVIYYTLDGSEPDPKGNPERTLTYEEPIFISDRSREPNNLSNIRTATDENSTYWRKPTDHVFKGTVVKAKAITQDGLATETATHTYFVHENMRRKYSLPILSISTDSNNFFDEETGLFVNKNWHNRGKDWEREANMEFYETDGTLGFSQRIGVRVHGAYSSNLSQKPLRLYARSEYGTNLIYYDLFGDESNLIHKRLLLRNSGNDFHYTMFRDALHQRLVKHMNMDTQGSRPVIVFINGEYWGIQNIRERYDKWYLANQYDVDEDDVTIIENDGEFDDGSRDGVEHYKAMISFVENNDLSVDKNYDYVQTLMDVDNFVDYYVAQMYLANTDWLKNNVRLWRYNKGEDPQPRNNSKGDSKVTDVRDGRWRWMLFDTDYGFGIPHGLGVIGGSNVNTNSLELATGDKWFHVLFPAFIKNEDFKVKFINRFSDMLNTAFLPERVLGQMEDFYELYKVEMREHIDRWSIPESYEQWEKEVDVLRRFAEERPGYQWEHLRDFFQLGDKYTISVENHDPAAGTVVVNSILVDESTPGVTDASNWSGYYFGGLPVTITAVPNDGYTFVGWEDNDNNIQDESFEVVLTEDITLKPVFAKEG